MRYEFWNPNPNADEHIFALDSGTRFLVCFHQIFWIWSFQFFGRDCPILTIETPWFDVFWDFRETATNVVRDIEE